MYDCSGEHRDEGTLLAFRVGSLPVPPRLHERRSAMPWPMRILSPLLSLSTLMVALQGCAAEPDSATTAWSEQPLIGNCSFIPGCKQLLEAGDGPFKASLITTANDAGEQRSRLSVTYTEPVGRSFLVCDRFPRQPALSLVFVTGPENARTPVTRSAPASCPTSYGDNGGASNSATFSLTEEEDPVAWEALFPRQPDGSRWYAMQVAASNARGEWDSQYGANYRLVLRPR